MADARAMSSNPGDHSSSPRESNSATDHKSARSLSGMGLGFLAIIVTLGLLGLALDHYHRTLGRLIARVITVEEPTSAAAYEMEINVLGAGLAVVKYVANGDPQQRERVLKDDQDFRKFRQTYDRLAETREEKELGRQIDAVYHRYRTVGYTLMDTRDQQATLVTQVAEGFVRMDELIDDRIQAYLERGPASTRRRLEESVLLEADVAEVGTWLGSYLSTGTPAHRRRVLDNLQDVRGHLTAFQRLAVDTSERLWGEHLELVFQQAATNINAILRTHDTLRGAEAEFIRLRGQLDDLLDEGVQALTRRDLNAAHALTKDTIQRLHRASLILLALSALGCAGAAAAIIQRSLRLDREVQRRRLSESARAQLLEQLVTTQEQERGRLARELHDELGQDLSALVLGLKELEQTGAAKSIGPEGSSGVKLLQELGGRLIEHMHTIAWELRPAALDDLGLHGALSSYLEDWMRRTRLPVDFHSELQGERLPGPVETTFYRIAQESLNNVMKHAGARSVSVVLQRRGHEIVMIVEDDGHGFVPEKVLPPSSGKGRLGLLGMKERARLAGGVLDVESAPGAGTTVLVRIPFAAPATKPAP